MHQPQHRHTHHSVVRHKTYSTRCGSMPCWDPRPHTSRHKPAVRQRAPNTHTHTQTHTRTQTHNAEEPTPIQLEYTTDRFDGQAKQPCDKRATPNPRQLFPRTPERTQINVPRDTGQGWALYLYKLMHAGILECSAAPSICLRFSP